MGTRLYIEEKGTELTWYGTKLYGYGYHTYEEHMELKSFQLLSKLGLVKQDEFYMEGCWVPDYKFELTPQQFIEFIVKYQFDLTTNFLEDNLTPSCYSCPPKTLYQIWILDEPDMVKLISSNKNKIISWG